MSDSGGGFKAVAEEIGEVAGEVATEVKDAVGEMIEQGVQSVTTSPLTPQQMQQQQQKQVEDQQKLGRVRKWFKDLEQNSAQVRHANQQKEAQRIQDQQKPDQPDQAGKPTVSQTPASQDKTIREDFAENMPELRGGRGKGG